MEDKENEFKKRIINDIKNEDIKERELREKELIKKIGVNARRALRIIKDSEEER